MSFSIKDTTKINKSDIISFDLPKTTIYKSEIDINKDKGFCILYNNASPQTNFAYTNEEGSTRYTAIKIWLSKYKHNINDEVSAPTTGMPSATTTGSKATTGKTSSTTTGANQTTKPVNNNGRSEQPTEPKTTTTGSKATTKQAFTTMIEGFDTQEDATIIGELVVELNSLNNEKAFACFLLKSKTVDATKKYVNSVSQIIALAGSTTKTSDIIELNIDIPNQDNCILYKSNAEQMFIFTVPIMVDSAIFNDKITEKVVPFGTSLKTNEYKVVTTINENSSDEIYIDCQPTGESPESIASYVPVNSKNTDDIAESEYMTAASHFFTFSIGLALCYFVVPVVYKFSVIDRINETVNTAWDRTAQLQASDMLISILVAYAVIYLTIHGYKIQSNSMKIMSIIVAILYILSFTIIQIKKSYPSFMTTLISNNPVQITLNDLKFENIQLIPGIIGSWFSKIRNNIDKLIVFEICYVLLIMFLYISRVFTDITTLTVFLTVINFNFILLACLFIIIVYKASLSKVLEIAQQQLTE